MALMEEPMKTIFLLLTIVQLVCYTAAAGETFQRELDGRTLELEEVYYEDFGEGLENWLAEGNAAVSVREGWLDVDGASGKGGYSTVWCRTPFQGPQLVEYDIRMMSVSRQSNINMFLLAANPDADGLIATTGERNGFYPQYHKFPNYLITILNTTSPADKRERLRVRMRQDPGFELVSEQWHEPLVFGKVHHVAYLIEPPRVSVYLDGNPIGQVDYDKTYTSGLHGLRIWRTHSIYDNFRVSRIVGR
jgi:uncharacterized protein DUF6250